MKSRIEDRSENNLLHLLPDLALLIRSLIFSIKLAAVFVRTTVAIFDDARNFWVARCDFGGSDIPRPRGAPENVCLLRVATELVLESGLPIEMLELLEAALVFNVALAPLVVGFLDAAFAE